MPESDAAPFVLLSRAHLAALAAVAITGAAATWIARRSSAAGRAVRIALAAVLICATAGFFAAVLPPGWTAWDILPLHLCDFLIPVAVFALLTSRPLACELLYFWACSGTALAMITPDLALTWPDPAFISYFALHGAVVVAAFAVTFGARRAPRRGAPLRVWGLTNLYALAVGAVDLATGMNFLFLREKPPSRTLLDWMGPWPVYLLLADALALALFLALDCPFRRQRARAGAARP